MPCAIIIIMLLALLIAQCAALHLPLQGAKLHPVASRGSCGGFGCRHHSTHEELKVSLPSCNDAAGNWQPSGIVHSIAPRHAAVVCGFLDKLAGKGNDKNPRFEVGQRVRVTSDVQFMHVPGHKEGFAANGAEGVVVRCYDEANLSSNREVRVEFAEPKKWVAHFEPWELAII